MVFTGAFAYIQWQKEATFGTAAACITTAGLPFGFEQKVTSLNFTNNKIPLSQLGDVRVKTYAYGQTQGSFSVDFVLSSPWFLELIGFKDSTAGGGCGPTYTHTWDIDNTSCTELMQSFTVQVGQESGGTDIVRSLNGSIANSATISTSIGEVVRVSLDANYANEAVTTGLDVCPASESICNHIPFTFAHGTLELPNCTVVAEVQCVSLTFTQNSEHLWGIGSSVASNTFRRLFEITGSFKASFTCVAQLERVFAQQNDTLCNATCAVSLAREQASLRLTFDNGEAGAESRIIQITLLGISIDSHSINIEPNEPIFQDIPFQARDADVVATNAIAASPATAS
jgi:hypothetical protein